MAITQALFKGYEKARSNNYRVLVQLTDPSRNPQTWLTWLEDVSGATLDAVAQSAATKIAAISAQEVSADVLADIAIDTPVPIVPTPDPGPTVEELADLQWVSDFHLLERVMRAQATVTLPNGQIAADISGLKGSVDAGYTTARALML